jgi:hypothetical protein
MRVESTRRRDGGNGVPGCALLLSGAVLAGLSCNAIDLTVVQEEARIASVATVLGDQFEGNTQRLAFADWWASGTQMDTWLIERAAENPMYADLLEYGMLLETARRELRTGEYERAQLLLMLAFERIKWMPSPPGSIRDGELCRGLLRGVGILRNGSRPDVKISVLPRMLGGLRGTGYASPRSHADPGVERDPAPDAPPPETGD